MQHCPNCNKLGITNLDNLRVGHDRKIECEICKNEFSVKKSSFIFFLLFLGINLISTIFLNDLYDFLVLLISFIIFAIIKIKYIKLYNINDIW